MRLKSRLGIKLRSIARGTQQPRRQLIAPHIPIPRLLQTFLIRIHQNPRLKLGQFHHHIDMLKLVLLVLLAKLRKLGIVILLRVIVGKFKRLKQFQFGQLVLIQHTPHRHVSALCIRIISRRFVRNHLDILAVRLRFVMIRMYRPRDLWLRLVPLLESLQHHVFVLYLFQIVGGRRHEVPLHGVATPADDDRNNAQFVAVVVWLGGCQYDHGNHAHPKDEHPDPTAPVSVLHAAFHVASAWRRVVQFVVVATLQNGFFQFLRDLVVLGIRSFHVGLLVLALWG
mmetsp:Transcript_32780/g.52478  ORF Transcript_32780/g.52478 Transcript_32780/m.52478 type:complete len:283 (-) Transcript_32780:219-1067(-)